MIETLIIFAIIGGAFGLVVLLFSGLGKQDNRDFAARQHDSALARLYDAKATKLQIENDQAQAELRLAANERRQQACDDVREEVHDRP